MTLIPMFQACRPRPPQLTNSNYATDLKRALREEITTPESAQEFFQGTYPTEAMRTLCRMIFDRLHNGVSSEQTPVYRFSTPVTGEAKLIRY